MTIVLILLKASLLLAAALLGTRLLRTAPAATRHGLWSVTFVALLALPALDGTIPAVQVPVPRAWTAMVPGSLSGPTPVLKAAPGPEDARPALSSGNVRAAHETVATSVPASWSAPAFRTPSLGTAARLVWLAGALAAAGVLLLSLVRVRHLARTAADVTDPAWREAADTIGARLGIRGPARVLISGAVRTPMAGGVWRPMIFLPPDAASWSGERRDIVLAHELSHIARRDPLRHLAARVAVGCYWFHPLAWIAAKHASLAREQACDENVLALGIRPSDYARVLLDLADTMARPSRAAALSMVERTLLEARLMSILEHGIRPSRLRRSVVPAVAAALLALTLAAAQPAARATSLQSPPPVPSPASPQTSPYTTCMLDREERTGFSGYTNTDERGVIRERVGTSNGRLIMQQTFDDMRVCMMADGDGTTTNDRALPSVWAARAPSVVIETARGGTRTRLSVLRHAGGTQTRWRVDDADRPFDAAGQAWRDAVLAVLDRAWEISSLRGEASSLHGDISSLRGEESSLRGEISSLHGEISSMRGEQASVRGEESMLRGEISTAQGEVSSLRGQIASERGSISSLEGSRYGLASADRDRLNAEIKAHQDEIARLERDVRDYDVGAKVAALEKQVRELDANGKVAAIEDRIRAFDEAGKVAAIEKQIQALNVEGKSAAIEKQIQALDVDRRSRQIEDRLDEAVRRLQQALAAIK